MSYEKFSEKQFCDHCGNVLQKGNMVKSENKIDTICLKCKAEEKKRKKYKNTVDSMLN